MNGKHFRGIKSNKTQRFFLYLLRGLFRLFALSIRNFLTPSIKKSLLLFQLRFQNSPTIELACSYGDIVMQVGTPNISTIIRYSKAVGNIGHVYIIEGSSQTFQYLQDSTTSLANVTLINEVISNSPDPVKWIETNIPGDNKISSPDTSIDNDFRPDLLVESITLKQPLSLDNLLQKYNIQFLNYISITVNGAEYSVLQSCISSISRQLFDIIYSKGHALSLKENIPCKDQISSLLTGLGYKTYSTKAEPSPIRGYQRAGDIIAFRNKFYCTQES